MKTKFAKKFSSVRMQLVASVFVAIAPALLLTYIVNQSWFWDFAPQWLKQYALDVPWASFSVGLLALIAAWFGGEHFILKQVKAMSAAARRIAAGDLTSRTGLNDGEGELGQLATAFDSMAASLERNAKEREASEKNLLNRAFQQTIIAALGQFALTNKDVEALLSQAVMLVAQTLEVEYSAIFKRMPDDQLLLQAGVGWKTDNVGKTIVPAENRYQVAYTLNTGEPVVVEDFKTETRFYASPLLAGHGVVSSVTVAIPTRERPFGVLGIHTTRQRIFTTDEVQFLLAVATAIGMAAERKRADAEMLKLAAFTQLNPNAALEVTADGAISYFNAAAQQLALSVKKNHPREVLPAGIQSILDECLATGQSRLRLETQMEGRTFSWSFHPVPFSGVVHCYVEDNTERLSLEAQLRQSQKMESIGQLAAGVAHDFNNMLTIIQGHSSAMLARPTLPIELLEPVQSVYFAAERAAGLTRQLLMFSRKNVMQLRPIDLREIVGDMSKMLQRLIHENILLEFHPPAELPLVLADSGMVEQVLMNLAVNARDAMPQGGSLTIGVETLQVDDEYVTLHPEARIGEFVRLRVTDSGCGMDFETLTRIFEPFFTTKEVGKGTGLGLATVYGIVKQHDGWLEVISEPGKGTTFEIFFPATDAMAMAVEKQIMPDTPVPGGTETILIVEDEPILRDMARDILEGCGYRIIEASSGKDALDVWSRRTTQIDLLLTDMMMPGGVSGVKLAEQLLQSQPGLKVVFTSGYTANEINPEVLAKTGACFLQKPYSHADLAKTIRDSIDKNTAAAPPLNSP
jgi:signal transduction histidine kinase/CheY-like chemotaxis protein/HAMP domain-containing protein